MSNRMSLAECTRLENERNALLADREERLRDAGVKIEPLVSAIVEVVQGCDPIAEEAKLREWLTRRLSHLVEAQRWIPVSEKLPDMVSLVLCFCKDGTTQLSLRHGVGGWFDLAVTHWRPLPPPPEVTK